MKNLSNEQIDKILKHKKDLRLSVIGNLSAMRANNMNSMKRDTEIEFTKEDEKLIKSILEREENQDKKD